MGSGDGREAVGALRTRDVAGVVGPRKHSEKALS